MGSVFGKNLNIVPYHPLIYVIILNWNRCQDTLTCLQSLSKIDTPNVQLMVVDNGSRDDQRFTIRQRYSQVKLIEAESNLGFAKGMNLGIRAALAGGADYVFLLNNDTIVDPAMLDHLLAHARPEVGLLAPAIFYMAAPKTIWSTGGGLSAVLLEMTGDHGRNQILPQAPQKRGFLTACGLLIPRMILEQVGLFDERFFMYYEDMDFCLRVQKAGYDLVLVPQAHLWHQISQSSGGSNSPNERYYMALSSGLYFRKHMQLWQAFLIIPYRLLSALRWSGRLIKDQQWAALTAYWRGLYVGWFRHPPNRI